MYEIIISKMVLHATSPRVATITERLKNENSPVLYISQTYRETGVLLGFLGPHHEYPVSWMIVDYRPPCFDTRLRLGIGDLSCAPFCGSPRVQTLCSHLVISLGPS